MTICDDNRSDTASLDILKRVEALMAEGGSIYKNEPEKALLLYEEAWRLSKEHNLFDQGKEMVPHIGFLYMHIGNLNKALEFNKEALLLGDLIEDDLLIARSCQAIGYLLAHMEQHGKAVVFYERGIVTAERSGIHDTLVALLNNLGTAYKELFRLPDSLNAYLKCLKLSEDNGCLRTSISVCNNLAAYFSSINDNEQYLFYTRKGIDLADQIDDPSTKTSLLNNLGQHCSFNNDFAAAIEYFDEVIAILKDGSNRQNILAFALKNAGAASMQMGEFKQAENYLNESIRVSEKYDMKDTLILAKIELAICMQKMGNSEEGCKLIEETLDILDTSTGNRLRLAAIHLLHDYYYEKGDYKESVVYLRKAYEIANTTFSSELSANTASLRVQFEMERTEREANLYRERSEELEQKNQALEEANEKLQDAQDEIRMLERRNSVYAMAVTANHEMNQPLMIIRGNLDMLEEEIDRNNLAKVRHLHRIQAAIDRIEQLLQKFRNMEGMRLGEYNRDTPMVLFDENCPPASARPTKEDG